MLTLSAVQLDAVGQPRHQGPAQTDRRAAAQPLRWPADPVADGHVDAFILEVALLVGDVGDQFLVDTPPDIGEIDRLHGQHPFPICDFSSGGTCFNPSPGRR